MSVYKVKDGIDGNLGSSAPMVLLTNENITFAGNKNGQVSAVTKTSNVVGYMGTQKVTPSIGNITGMPTGMTVSVGTAVNEEIPITITIVANATLGGAGEQSGTLLVPVTSPMETTLEITWSKVNTGADGTSGTPGENAIVFEVWAPNGTVFVNSSGSLAAEARGYDGSSEITSGAMDHHGAALEILLLKQERRCLYHFPMTIFLMSIML